MRSKVLPVLIISVFGLAVVAAGFLVEITIQAPPSGRELWCSGYRGIVSDAIGLQGLGEKDVVAFAEPQVGRHADELHRGSRQMSAGDLGADGAARIAAAADALQSDVVAYPNPSRSAPYFDTSRSSPQIDLKVLNDYLAREIPGVSIPAC